ncbi:hypothetical protein SRHO_G00071760 [Serrasalmus rhombeus]
MKLGKVAAPDDIMTEIDVQLTDDQAGCRPRKSCTGQLLNLTQYIEDGYQKKMITAVAFVVLTAAYDTVQPRLLIKKLYDVTGIAPPYIWRAITTQVEQTKQANDIWHLFHAHCVAHKRLGSRSSFLDTTDILDSSPASTRASEWLKHWNSFGSQTAQ